MNKLVHKYIQPIPVLIVGACMLLGILAASLQKASGWDALTYVFGCIFTGWLFAHGYIEQKQNIFLWALIGIGLKILLVGIQGNNQIMIADLLLESSKGAFIGLLIEENARRIFIGALTLGLLATILVMLFPANNELFASSEKVNNQLIEYSNLISQWVWLGAFGGGLIGRSYRNTKASKPMTTIKM